MKRLITLESEETGISLELDVQSQLCRIEYDGQQIELKGEVNASRGPMLDYQLRELVDLLKAALREEERQ